jgi:hypothetical protein
MPFWDKNNKVEGVMVTVMMVWFERGERESPQIHSFHWVLRILSLVCSLVGQHPQAWVEREVSLLPSSSSNTTRLHSSQIFMLLALFDHPSSLKPLPSSGCS